MNILSTKWPSLIVAIPIVDIVIPTRWVFAKERQHFFEQKKKKSFSEFDVLDGQSS